MEWIMGLPSWHSVAQAAVAITILYVAVLALTKITGSRTLATLSGTDLATTVAIGSALAAATVAQNPNLLIGLMVLIFLFVLHYLVDYLRQASRRAENLMEDKPLLLMCGSEVIQEHLRSGSITRAELRVHLRQAGVRHRDQICAVSLERTGSITVLASSSDRPGVDPWLVDDVPEKEKLLLVGAIGTGTQS